MYIHDGLRVCILSSEQDGLRGGGGLLKQIDVPLSAPPIINNSY